MALSGTLDPVAILAPVDNETTGQRVKRMRKELKWTQADLVKASGVSEATLYLIENDKPPKRNDGRAVSVAAVIAALEAEQERRTGSEDAGRRLVMSVLEGATVKSHEVRHLGPRGKVRYVTIVASEEGLTPAEYAQAIEELHRRQREG